MSYTQIKKKKQIICSGDLNKRISVETRTLTTPGPGSVDYEQTFTSFKNMWAMIETRGKGTEIFDGVNVIGTATHYFYVRYTAGLTFEKFVNYNDEYYRILDVENINEDNSFYVLKCTKRGDDTLEANYA